jgi:biotin transport system substrate-specific component
MNLARTRTTVTAALVAALIAVSAFISIPVGTVPLTLQVMAVVLAALVLSPVGALAATGTYLLIGAIGVPVFAGGKAGLAVLAGPTGGFLLGFMLGAFLGAWVRKIAEKRIGLLPAYIAASAIVIIVVYVVGWLQLSFVTGMGLSKAFALGVVPFVPWDALKAAAAIGFAISIRKAGALPSL